MKIRKVTSDDLEQVVSIEAICFPKSEAASKESLRNRIETYPECFWVLEDKGKILSFINGMYTNEIKIKDEMFESSELYNSKGDWLAIFGVVTLPEYQGQGLATKLMETVINEVNQQGHKGCVLTCKDKLIVFYERFGYINCGVSQSVHGGAIWYDMVLRFKGKY